MSRNDAQSSIDVGDIELERLSSYAIKAEVYIVSLTFSILALSIQFPAATETAGSLVARLQAAGCLILVISGIAGIKTLRNVSSKYNILMSKYRLVKTAVDSASSFEQAKAEIFSSVFEAWFSEVSKQNAWLLPIQGYCLVSGLLFLVFSRILATPLIWLP